MVPKAEHSADAIGALGGAARVILSDPAAWSFERKLEVLWKLDVSADADFVNAEVLVEPGRAKLDVNGGTCCFDH